VDWLSVGRVTRAHGIRGEIAVKSDRPHDSVLLHVKKVHLLGEQNDREVRSARAVDREVLLRLSDVPDRTAAEALRGKEVQVRREDFPPADEGEFYFTDLVGLEAFDPSGKPLGKLQQVWETGPVPVLVIGEGEHEVLVPFAESFVKVDLPGKRLVVQPPVFDE
jgi:16S rRNA processing protein RimM